MGAIANQAKQLRQDCLRGHERQSKLSKYFYTNLVPAIIPIQER